MGVDTSVIKRKSGVRKRLTVKGFGFEFACTGDFALDERKRENAEVKKKKRSW